MLGKTKVFMSIIVIFVILMSRTESFSGMKDLCERGSFIDFIFDIRWETLFPISFAGITLKGSKNNPGNPPYLEKGSAVCYCTKNGRPILGLTMSYWNPVEAIETTKIPMCLSTLNIYIDIGDAWKNMGTLSQLDVSGYTFANAHQIKLNVLDILNLFMDVPCVPHEGFGIAFFTEFMASEWNNSLASYFLHPEVLLFANPAASLACAADSVAATAGWPIDALFWCAGGWGSVYPFTGHVEDGNYIRANVLDMARLYYLLHRTLISYDTGIDYCGAVLTPIWIKSHVKFHQMRPVRGPVLTIGTPTILWSSAKNPPGGTKKGSPDNFSWMIWKLVRCCMSFI